MVAEPFESHHPMFSRLIMMSVQPPPSVSISQYALNAADPPTPSGSIQYVPFPVAHAYAFGALGETYHWQFGACVPSAQVLPDVSSPDMPISEQFVPANPDAQAYVQVQDTAEYVHA